MDKVIDELTEYRAIGTPTQILEKIGGLCVELGKYACIGTVEELQRAKQMEAVYGQVKWERDIAISQLEEIGISLGQKMDDIKALKEKSEPMKPAYQGEHEKCPTCGSFCIDVYCAKCGQAIDWQ